MKVNQMWLLKQEQGDEMKDINEKPIWKKHSQIQLPKEQMVYGDMPSLKF